MVRLEQYEEEERNHFEIHYVAGGYNFERLNFLEKFIIKKVAGVTSSQEVIKQDKLALYLKK